MHNYPVYKNLAGLNDLSRAEAVDVFLACCGSREWATQMADARPFPMLEQLFETAEEIWESLPPADWLEAFAAHPKIGSKKGTPKQRQRSAEWSAGEQSSITEASPKVRRQIAELNRLYHEKFGFIFIVCATGKSADEMLAILKARIGNSVRTELRLAAEEQKKITAVRIAKLLER